MIRDTILAVTLILALAALWTALSDPSPGVPFSLNVPDGVSISITCPTVALWCF